MQVKKRTNLLALLLFALAMFSCKTISPYNETAYQQATSIKATALILMEQATKPYPNYREQAQALLLEAHKAYEYAKQRPKNEESTKQWAIMIDPNRKMLAGFLAKWKADTTLGKFFIQEAKDQISDGFDTISGLEIAKDK